MSNRRILIRSTSPEDNSILSICPAQATKTSQTSHGLLRCLRNSSAVTNRSQFSPVLRLLRNKRRRRPIRLLLHYIITTPKVRILWFYKSCPANPNPSPANDDHPHRPFSSSNELKIEIDNWIRFNWMGKIRLIIIIMIPPLMVKKSSCTRVHTFPKGSVKYEIK